ncbi:CRTAC1 family protein [Candidatus Poribacteria bacterium]|nr:CRTAC1 family protein [Candidatus Poribacteria bacterium]
MPCTADRLDCHLQQLGRLGLDLAIQSESIEHLMSHITLHISRLTSYLTCFLIFTFFICLLAEAAGPYFRDVTAEMGLDFRHVNGFSPERRLIETMGSGGALFDYDNDGDLDLYLVQGNYLPQGALQNINRLYRNDGDHFTDVTAEAGVGDSGYGMGAVAADYDGDGDLDLYVTNFGQNVLYRNNGDGTFTDVTEGAGVGCPLLSTSAAYGDYDRDGDLDLYVCNYVEYSLETDVPCHFRDMRIYCGPNEYHGIADTLYRNNGDGTFTDVTKESGVYEPTTRGLGVVFTDVNDDGWLDIYVANDMTPNTLFINQGDGRFREEGTLRGAAYNGDGIANGSMGVDAGDYDNDGDSDFWVTNFSLEANCLMQNDGNGYFYDTTFDVGLAVPSFYMLGFGTRFLDFDNDGWLDLFVGNGHIWDNVERIDPNLRYAEPVQLFRNRDGTFMDITDEAGLGEKSYVVRGMLFGDIDNDGDVDVVLCQSNRPAVILRNEVGTPFQPLPRPLSYEERGEGREGGKAWLLVKLVGREGNLDAIGARVRLTANGMTQTREVICGASYLAGNDLRLLFGLGDAKAVERLEIRWPDGALQTLENLPTRQLLTVRQ